MVIPQAFRKALKIFPRSEVVFKMEGDKLIPHESHEEVLEERVG